MHAVETARTHAGQCGTCSPGGPAPGSSMSVCGQRHTRGALARTPARPCGGPSRSPHRDYSLMKHRGQRCYTSGRPIARSGPGGRGCAVRDTRSERRTRSAAVKTQCHQQAYWSVATASPPANVHTTRQSRPARHASGVWCGWLAAGCHHNGCELGGTRCSRCCVQVGPRGCGRPYCATCRACRCGELPMTSHRLRRQRHYRDTRRHAGGGPRTLPRPPARLPRNLDTRPWTSTHFGRSGRPTKITSRTRRGCCSVQVRCSHSGCGQVAGTSERRTIWWPRRRVRRGQHAARSRHEGRRSRCTRRSPHSRRTQCSPRTACSSHRPECPRTSEGPRRER